MSSMIDNLPLSRPLRTQSHPTVSLTSCWSRYMAGGTQLLATLEKGTQLLATLALNAVIRVFKYLLQTKDLAISAKLHDPECDITDKLSNLQLDEKPQFRFYTDTDHAGNCEVQNKHRLQNGLAVTYHGAPVKWYSKAKSSCTASP